MSGKLKGSTALSACRKKGFWGSLESWEGTSPSAGQIDHQFCFVSPKRKVAQYCLINHNSFAVRSPAFIHKSEHSCESSEPLWTLCLFLLGQWDGFFVVLFCFALLFIRLGSIKCDLGPSHSASGVHLEKPCCCHMTGGSNVLQVVFFRELHCLTGRNTRTAEQGTHWNDDQWRMWLFNSLGSKRTMPFLQDT